MECFEVIHYTIIHELFVYQHRKEARDQYVWKIGDHKLKNLGKKIQTQCPLET